METTANTPIRHTEINNGSKAAETGTSQIEAKDHRASFAQDTSACWRCVRTQAKSHAEASSFQGEGYAKRRKALPEKGAERGAARQG